MSERAARASAQVLDLTVAAGRAPRTCTIAPVPSGLLQNISVPWTRYFIAFVDSDSICAVVTGTPACHDSADFIRSRFLSKRFKPRSFDPIGAKREIHRKDAKTAKKVGEGPAPRHGAT